jgi:hypothetical protein
MKAAESDPGPTTHAIYPSARSTSASDGLGLSLRTLARSNPIVITNATPHRASSHDSETAYKIVDDIRVAVYHELTDAWVQEDESTPPFQAHLKVTVDAEYPGLDARIEEWLESYGGYDNDAKKWRAIPFGAKEEKIHDPIVEVMSNILTHFGHEENRMDGKVMGRREVKKTHRLLMPHNARDAAALPLKSEPDISVFGSGPAATKDVELPADPSYAEATSLWEVKTEETFGKDEKGQVGTYVREVFIQQPTRRFVYATVMTSKLIRILRFDRARCYYSRRVNYHTDALFFVKMVLLLSSFNEALVGFDTSIFWDNGVRVMNTRSSELFQDAT